MTIYGNQSLRFGLKKESVRGTAETSPDKWYPINPDIEISFGPTLLPVETIKGIRAEDPPVAGRNIGTGKISLPLDSQTIGEFLYSLFGDITSAEQSEITITSANKYIDFDIGGGELTATLTEASYPIGTAETEAGTLCKEIYDQIVAAEGAGVYTVSYSRTTKLFTITRSAGTFNILWKTGTHGSDNADDHIGTTIGFLDTADDTGSLSYASDNTIEYIFQHSLTIATSIQPIAYTFFVDYGLIVKKYSLSCVKSISIAGPVDNLIQATVEFLFKDEADGSIGSPSFPTQQYLSFQHADYKIAGSSNTDVKSFNLVIDNQAQALLTLSLAQEIQDVITPMPMMVTGDMMIFFQSETERDKFLANTGVALRMLIEGATIIGSHKWSVDLPITQAHYSSYPFAYEENLLGASVEFKGHYDGSSLILPIIKNQDVSY